MLETLLPEVPETADRPTSARDRTHRQERRIEIPHHEGKTRCKSATHAWTAWPRSIRFDKGPSPVYVGAGALRSPSSSQTSTRTPCLPVDYCSPAFSPFREGSSLVSTELKSIVVHELFRVSTGPCQLWISRCWISHPIELMREPPKTGSTACIGAFSTSTMYHDRAKRGCTAAQHPVASRTSCIMRSVREYNFF